MSVLSPSGLETADYNLPGWVHIFNKNIDKLNETLLKIDAMADVSADDKKDEAFLVWAASSSKWIARNFSLVGA